MKGSKQLLYARMLLSEHVKNTCKLSMYGYRQVGILPVLLVCMQLTTLFLSAVVEPLEMWAFYTRSTYTQGLIKRRGHANSPSTLYVITKRQAP